jgi:type II secretory pathway pseudopilin PulG
MIKLKNNNKGFTIIEAAVVLGIMIILAVGATIGFQQVLKSAGGATCTTQLNKINTAQMSLKTIFNIQTSGDWSANTANVRLYLDNKTYEGNTGTIKCPTGGEYATGDWNATFDLPNPPTCTLGTEVTNQAAKLHYIPPPT